LLQSPKYLFHLSIADSGSFLVFFLLIIEYSAAINLFPGLLLSILARAFFALHVYISCQSQNTKNFGRCLFPNTQKKMDYPPRKKIFSRSFNPGKD